MTVPATWVPSIVVGAIIVGGFAGVIIAMILIDWFDR